MQYYFKKGFALPTVMIASVVMLMVLLVSLQGVVSVNVAMNAQHYDDIALESAYSGATYAKKCLVDNNYVASWSSSRLLMPNTDCSGNAIATCSQLKDSNCALYVDNDNNLRTTFYVSYPSYNTSGKLTGMAVTGLVQLLRKSDDTVWDQYSQNVRISVGGIYTSSWTQISSGGNHTCAIASDNNAYCWGNNSSGQLGNNSTTTSTVPVQVNNSGVLNGKTIKQISSGGNHTCAIASDNNAYCWGNNDYGQLGNGTSTDNSNPVAVTRSGVLSGLSITSISSGDFGNTCVIASNSNAYCWGYNDSDGELGNNGTASSSNPVAVYKSGSLLGLGIKSISVGYYHTCVIASDNNAYCWGYNSYGQLGNGSTTHALQPQPIDNADNLSGLKIINLSLGYYHTCVIASDNNAYCWGYNSYGQLGNQQSATSTTPVAVYRGGALSSKYIAQISSGGNHTCAIASDNNAYCWGYNSYGQLGTNSYNSSSTATIIDSSYQTNNSYLYTY